MFAQHVSHKTLGFNTGATKKQEEKLQCFTGSQSPHGDFHEHREAAMISMGVGGTYLEPHAWGLGAKTH